MLTVADIKQALDVAASPFDVKAAYLFGSFARGDARPDSDVDIRLDCGPGIGYGELLDIQEQMESILGCSVELITNPPELMRPAFRRRIEKDEVLLYEAA